MQEWCKERGLNLFTDGLKIYTTIDSKMQMHAEDAVAQHMKVLQRRFFQHWQGQNPWIYKNKKEIPGFIEDAVKRIPLYSVIDNKFKNDKNKINDFLNAKKTMNVFSWDGEKDTTFSIVDSLKYYKHFLHSGFMAMDPTTGHIKAWVGGNDYKFFKYDHVIQSKRQPGSAFKPFVYTAAIEKGYKPCDFLIDEPINFVYEENGITKSWAPKNADWVFTGDSLSLRQAIGRSVNSIAAHLTKIIGVEEIIKCAKRMGITSDIQNVPSVGLGSSDVSIFEMVGAYSVFANKGVWIEPHFVSRVEDRNGNVLFEYMPEIRDVLSEENAYTMIHMLKGSVEERGGTSQGLFQYDIFKNNEIGGKTGTTSNYSDGWFMGVTKKIVAGTWVGGEDRAIHFKSSALGEGGKMALPIFGLFLEKIYNDPAIDIVKGRFEKPKNYSIDLNCPYRITREDRDTLDEDDIQNNEESGSL
jgi:penicillin-binding protein 1A